MKDNQKKTKGNDGYATAVMALVGASLTMLVYLLTEDHIATAVSAGAILLLMSVVINPYSLHTISALILLLTGTSFTSSAVAPIATRAAAVTILLALTLRPRESESSTPKSPTHFAVAIWITITLIGAVHKSASEVSQAALGFAALVVFIVIPLRSLTGRQILKSWWWALAAYCATSLITGFIAPQYGIENDRLRGVAENANQIGFSAAMLLIVTLILERRVRYLLITLALVGPILALSASRASTLTSVVALTLAAALGMRHTRILAAASLLTAGYVLSSASIRAGLMDATLLRTNDSRASSFTEAMRAFKVDPLYGVGFGGIEATIASSPLRAMAAGGLLAIAFLGIAMIIVLRSTALGSRHVSVLVIPALLHSLFEGWLVSTSGPIIIMFTAIWTATLVRTQEGDPDGPDNSLAEQRQHPSGTAHTAARDPRGRHGSDRRWAIGRAV